MKTARKQRRGRLISARREVAEQNRIRNGYERNLAQQLVTVFNRIGRRAGEQYQQGGLRTINRNQNTQDLAAVIIPSVRATMTAMIDRFQLISPKQSPYERFIEQYINTQVGSHIQNIEATTMNQIRRAILEGTEQDLGPEPISRLIRGRVGGDFGRRRAITIARTETHSAASYANNSVAKESGVDLKKRWVSTNDERTREHHRAVNGQEVGMDEDFIVPYKGVDYAMGFAGDPRGGPANVINCRCVIVYFEDEDVIIDDPVTEAVQEPDFVDPTPEKPSTTPRGVYDSPIRASLTAATIPSVAIKVSLEKLRLSLKDAANNDAYLSPQTEKPVSRYSGTKVTDFGEVGSSGIKKQIASAMAEVNEELNELADRLNVPRLRGYKNIRGAKAWGNMGDGVMGLNYKTFNSVLETTVDAETARRTREIGKRFKELDDEANDVNVKLTRAFNRYKKRLGDEKLKSEFKAAQQRADEFWLSQKGDDLRFYQENRSFADKSEWKLGDNVAERPYSSKQYYEDPLDKLRSTMYHEFGHHVHQMWNPRIKGHSGSGEIEVKILPELNRGGTLTGKDNVPNLPSNYAGKNEHEWFAENFSLFWMNKRRDLVDRRFIEIMETVTGERYT